MIWDKSQKRIAPQSLEELAQLLEIDLTLGRRDHFRRRLKHALEEAYNLKGMKSTS